MHDFAWPLGPPDLRDSRGPWSSGCLMEAWFVLCGSDIALSSASVWSFPAILIWTEAWGWREIESAHLAEELGGLD